MKHFYQTCGEKWFNYPDIYSQAVFDANDNSHFVEVGSWKGMSSTYMAVEIINSKKNIKFDCIDLWGTDPDKIYANKKDLYDTFIKNIEPVKNIINPIISNSWEAASLYEDHSLDFVWLDAGHDYEDIKKDIAAWYPKVKIGGTIAGHDFTTAPGVSQAVCEYFNKDFKQINTSWLHIKNNNMTTVNEYFDKVFVINLKERPEKLNDCTKLLNKLNIEFEVYEALNCVLGIPEDYPEKPLVGFLTNKPGAFGCLISHLEVIKIAKERGYEKILVLEDDIDATKNFLELFSEKIKDLPDDWHLVYLGGSGHTGSTESEVTEKITENISKTFSTYTTSSYGVHIRAYETIIERNEGPKRIPNEQFYWAYKNIYPC